MPSPLEKVKQKASSVSIAQLLKQIPDIRGTDYDLEGYYADHGIPYKSLEDMALSHAITGAHYSDEDKMPWHTSFSNHSKYSDSDMEGGKWQRGGSEGSELWNFTPSEINMEYNSPEAYKRMWLENQPKGTFISLPNGDVIEGNEGKYAEGGSVDKPLAHLPGNPRLGKITPEDIKAATEDFNGSYLPDMLTAAIQRIKHDEDFNQHANEYREMVNDLKKYYPTPREDRSPRDKASNYAGAYDYAQRVRHTEPMDNVINAAKGYQMYQDVGNGDRTDDAINDYLENKAGVETAYADKDLPLKDREEILKNAVMFTEGQGYAEGGSVKYNPSIIDQIIDDTHKELGTGRYAEGGSVNKMQAIPQNENLAALAEALSKGRDVGNKVELPYIGGIGDLLVGKTPEEIDNWSYGNAPMQIPEMSNLPQFKKGRGESFADAVTTLLPLAKGTKDVPAGLSFIGPNSKGWDKVAAELAAKKLDEGVDPEQVWQEHLIGRLPSGHLFSEISDAPLTVRSKNFNDPYGSYGIDSNKHTNFDEVQDLLDEGYPEKTIHKMTGWARPQGREWMPPLDRPLEQKLIEHDPLSELYDFHTLKTRGRLSEAPLSSGHFNSQKNEIVIDADPDNKGMLQNTRGARSVAAHELQHAIQNKEGWPIGGSPKDFSNATPEMYAEKETALKNEILSTNDPVQRKNLQSALNLLEATKDRYQGDPYLAYQRLTGEAQARATQDRLDMDMAQRRESYPLAGDKLSDISLKDLINKYEGDGPSMSASSDNLNADLLEKYLVTGKLSPDDMALYEDNALMMEDPNLQTYNLENARAQIPSDMDRMSATEFTTPAYHSSRKQDDIYEFGNRIYDTSLFNGLGVHSGTKAAAKQRAEDTAGYNRDTGKRNPDLATYYPLQLRANKSFEINGRPTNEHGAEIHLDSLGRPLGMGRETDTGRAAIQDAYFKNNDVLKYINDVEDKGSVSYISPPENIRSRFAAFDPLRKNSTSILANVLGGTALSDLALKYEDKAQDSGDQYYADGGSIDKDSMELNKPQRTPNHPTKSHIVKTMVDGKEKIIRFGEQGAETAGKPKEGEPGRMKAKRESFKARHAKNIAKGPSSAAYWANKVKWNEGGSVEYNPIKIDQIIDATHKELGTGRYADGGSVNTTLKLG
jgi:hypothetical protein